MKAATSLLRSIELKTASPADRIALRGVRVRSTLVGMSQLTTLEQTFTDLEPRPIEAVYTFPLPAGAAVCGFDVIAGDRVLAGVIDEADQAIDRYESAVREGHGAFLLEQQRPDVFSASVGNLKPGQTVIVRVEYLCPLQFVGRSIRIAFPTTIAPRYAAATGMDPISAAIDGDALNPPHALAVPYGLSLDVHVDLANIVKAINSPSHAIVAEALEDGWHVRFPGEVAEMDRDVVLELSLKKERKPVAELARDSVGQGEAGGSAFVAVSFVPEFDAADLAAPQPGETIFVLDCSGSMQGESIAQAKLALALCLRSLSQGDKFNICRFGSTFELLSPLPVAYTEDTLAMALAYVERIDADLGCTEIHAPLAEVMKHRPAIGRVRQVIVLTDGQVTNEPAVIQLAREHRQHNRIFSFGIGAAASEHLVRGLAGATGGAAEFISAGEAIHEKVLRTFGRIASPPVTDVRVDWGDADVVAAPEEIPPVFDGEALAVFGKLAGTRIPRHITLHCNTPAGAISWTVALAESRHPAIQIGRLWARQRMADIESREQISAASSKRSPAAKELVALSKQFNLICSLTMFLAVEHRTESDRTEGRPALRRVPLQMAAGWHGIDICAMAAAPAGGGVLYRKAPAAGARASTKRRGGDPFTFFSKTSAALPGFGSGLLDLTRESDDDELGDVLDELSRAVPAAPASPRAPAQPAEPVQLADLLLCQNAKGAFILRSPRLTESSDVRAARYKAQSASLTSKKKFTDFDTIAVLLVLATKYADHRPTWQRAAAKAKSYLARALSIDLAKLEAWLLALEK